VTLYCPVCGNDQFESLDEEFDDLIDSEIIIIYNVVYQTVGYATIQIINRRQ